MKISIGTVILARGSEYNEQPYDLTIDHERHVQAVTVLRATSAKYYDRGNHATTLEFKVSKRHDNVESAQKYVIQHAASLIDLPSTLVITEEPSQEEYSLSNAVVVKVVSSSEGVVSTHFYRIIGGDFS